MYRDMYGFGEVSDGEKKANKSDSNKEGDDIIMDEFMEDEGVEDEGDEDELNDALEKVEGMLPSIMKLPMDQGNDEAMLMKTLEELEKEMLPFLPEIPKTVIPDVTETAESIVKKLLSANTLFRPSKSVYFGGTEGHDLAISDTTLKIAPEYNLHTLLERNISRLEAKLGSNYVSIYEFIKWLVQSDMDSHLPPFKARLEKLIAHSLQFIISEENILDENTSESIKANEFVNLYLQLDQDKAIKVCRELFIQFLLKNQYWFPLLSQQADFDMACSDSVCQCFSTALTEVISQIELTTILSIKLEALTNVSENKDPTPPMKFINKRRLAIIAANKLQELWRSYLASPNQVIILFDLIKHLKFIENQFNSYAKKLAELTDNLNEIKIDMDNNSDEIDEDSDSILNYPKEKCEEKFKQLMDEFSGQVPQITSSIGDNNLKTLLTFYTQACMLLLLLEYKHKQDSINHWRLLLGNLNVIAETWSEAMLKEPAKKIRKNSHYSNRKTESERANNIFQEGPKSPNPNGDCGYVSLAWGIIVLVLLRRMPEAGREEFYLHLQKKLDLPSATQESLRSWILQRNFATCLDKLSFELREFTVQCEMETCSDNTAGYHSEIWNCYSLVQEEKTLRAAIEEFDKTGKLEAAKKAQDRLNIVSEQLSSYQYRHDIRLKAFLNAPNKTYEQVVVWWEETAKNIYLQGRNRSRRFYLDSEQASGDTEIFLDQSQLMILALKLQIGIIHENKKESHTIGTNCLIARNLLDEPEEVLNASLLMSASIGEIEEIGFRLSTFSDEETLASRLKECACPEEVKVSIRERYCNWPYLRIGNEEGIHWIYTLSKHDAAQLQSMQAEFVYLLGYYQENRTPAMPEIDKAPSSPGATKVYADNPKQAFFPGNTETPSASSPPEIKSHQTLEL